MIINDQAINHVFYELKSLSAMAHTIHSAMANEFGSTSPTECQADLANRLFEVTQHLSAHHISNTKRIQEIHDRRQGSSEDGWETFTPDEVTVKTEALEYAAFLITEIMLTDTDKKEELAEVLTLLTDMIKHAPENEF